MKLTKSRIISEAIKNSEKARKPNATNESNKLKKNINSLGKLFEQRLSYCGSIKPQREHSRVTKIEFETKGIQKTNKQKQGSEQKLPSQQKRTNDNKQANDMKQTNEQKEPNERKLLSTQIRENNQLYKNDFEVRKYQQTNDQMRENSQMYKNEYEPHKPQTHYDQKLLLTPSSLINDKLAHLSNYIEQINTRQNPNKTQLSIDEKTLQENEELKELKANMSQIQLEFLTLKNLILKSNDPQKDDKVSKIAINHFTTPENQTKNQIEKSVKFAQNLNSNNVKFQSGKYGDLKQFSDVKRSKFELNYYGNSAKTKEDMMRLVSRDKTNSKANLLRNELSEIEPKSMTTKLKKMNMIYANGNIAIGMRPDVIISKKTQLSGSKSKSQLKASFVKEIGR